MCAAVRYVTSVHRFAAARRRRAPPGRGAACHWAFRELLRLFGALPDARRVERDGNRFTAGGVTAGIDMALAVSAEIAGIPAVAGLGRVPEVVQRFGADTVAVLACPEMSGVQLRDLAWELEKTDTDLCVAPALLAAAISEGSDRTVALTAILPAPVPVKRGPPELPFRS